jgi:hypothetical protein
MQVSVNTIEKVLDALCQQEKQTYDHTGLRAIAAEISEGLGEKYLYEKLHLPAKKARQQGEAVIDVSPSKMEVISKFLGFNSFRALQDSWIRPSDPILLSLIGNYYLYVRRNDPRTLVMRSPVHVSEDSGNVIMEVRGPLSTFKGTLELTNGCLFVLLRSSSEKRIHHVYKIGRREKPKVLQGIFSGVTTAFDPIGGRVVLARTELPKEKMSNLEQTIGQLKKSNVPGESKLANYFRSFEGNNLRIGQPRTFSFDDLDL